MKPKDETPKRMTKFDLEKLLQLDRNETKALKNATDAHRVQVIAQGEADILLVDDTGKEKATERFEPELFSLLEHRTSHLRKTIYTSNLSLVDQRMKFSKEQGAAIIRRIDQFSKCVEITDRKIATAAGQQRV